jgi:hypothetical protein
MYIAFDRYRNLQQHDLPDFVPRLDEHIRSRWWWRVGVRAEEEPKHFLKKGGIFLKSVILRLWVSIPVL